MLSANPYATGDMAALGSATNTFTTPPVEAAMGMASQGMLDSATSANLATGTTTGSNLADTSTVNGGTPGATLSTPGASTGATNNAAVPPLQVKVEGLEFAYQFTEDDVRKVFSRYGDVVAVAIATDGASATVYYGTFQTAMQAWSDLNGKQLTGITGARLNVDCPLLSGVGTGVGVVAPGLAAGNAALAAQASAAAAIAANAGVTASVMNPYATPAMPGISTPGLTSSIGMMSTMNGVASPLDDVQLRNQQFLAYSGGNDYSGNNLDPSQGKKYTCRLEIGIENEKEFRVGSKVIQVARKIWQELPEFQEHGGKTRLRGKGVGGPHESEEPLALCISCRDATAFEHAVQFAEQQIKKIHQEYERVCAERGYQTPNLKEVKAICDHPHTSAPWHAAKFDHHHPYGQGKNDSNTLGTVGAARNSSNTKGATSSMASPAMDPNASMYYGGAMAPNAMSYAGKGTGQFAHNYMGNSMYGAYGTGADMYSGMSSTNPMGNHMGMGATHMGMMTGANVSVMGPGAGTPAVSSMTNMNNMSNGTTEVMDKGKRPEGLTISEKEIEGMIEERNEARKGGNFSRADELRDILKNKGIVLMDDKGARGNKKGTQVTKWRYWNP